MKKLSSIILLSAMLLFTSSTKAIQTQNIQSQKDINQNTAEQSKAINSESFANITNMINALGNRYVNDFRTCEPAHLKEYIDFFGLKINIQFDINGWENGKCGYYFKGNIASIGKDIREVFNVQIPDEKIAKIEPIVECGFDKNQLNLLVDAFMEKQQQNEQAFNDILKNPDNISKLSKKRTEKEEQVIKMLTDGKTCKIPNSEEVMKNVSEVMKMPL